MTSFRLGSGIDVHRLVEGEDLILGGVTIPYEKGLLGHSDADVLVHSLIDALLGALALGDIGQWFPDTDNEYAGISSLDLLERVINSPNYQGWKISNIDLTIIAEAPKMNPYLDEMRHNLSKCLSIDISLISIKATTTERLGLTGRGEGIASQASVLVYQP